MFPKQVIRSEVLTKTHFKGVRHLGSSGYTVQVQVLSSAPDNDNPNPVPIGDGFGFLVYL